MKTQQPFDRIYRVFAVLSFFLLRPHLNPEP